MRVSYVMRIVASDLECDVSAALPSIESKFWRLSGVLRCANVKGGQERKRAKVGETENPLLGPFRVFHDLHKSFPGVLLG